MFAYISLAFLLLFGTVRADQAEPNVVAAIDARADEFAAVAHSIWQYAELGYLEQQSSALLQVQLAVADFRIEQGVAGIPTAFIAERVSGRPVVALLAEFDALPGLSQQAVAERRPSLLASGCSGQVARARSDSTVRQPKKEARGRSIWCVPDSLTMSTRCSTGILRTATLPVRARPWPTSRRSSAFTELPRTRLWPPSAVAMP